MPSVPFHLSFFLDFIFFVFPLLPQKKKKKKVRIHLNQSLFIKSTSKTRQADNQAQVQNRYQKKKKIKNSLQASRTHISSFVHVDRLFFSFLFPNESKIFVLFYGQRKALLSLRPATTVMTPIQGQGKSRVCWFYCFCRTDCSSKLVSKQICSSRCFKCKIHY